MQLSSKLEANLKLFPEEPRPARARSQPEPPYVSVWELAGSHPALHSWLGLLGKGVVLQHHSCLGCDQGDEPVLSEHGAPGHLGHERRQPRLVGREILRLH